MSEQKVMDARHKDSSLYIFEGLEGFEELNSTDDSILVSLLDDLQDETLLTLLDDSLLVQDLQDSPFEGSIQNDHSRSPAFDGCVAEVPISDHVKSQKVQAGMQLTTVNYSHDVNRTKRQRRDVNPMYQKKAKLDDSLKYDTTDVVLARIMHDHCYATTSCHSNSNSDEETGNEEGSSSDTGYETMSSPGSSSSSTKTVEVLSHCFPSSHQSGLTHSTSLHSVDPVALIDERIKHYMCSREVNLTEEEKEILKAEGLPIPTTLPLTKVEERALKSVRRKIRNRVAAQESRKRKKEFVQTLEGRVSDYCRENKCLKKRVEALENENKSLLEQLKKLQATISRGSSSGAKFGTCIMVIILCFAIFFGGPTPSNLWSSHAEYTTASVRSRSLLSLDPKMNFCGRASYWFKQLFFREQFNHFEVNQNNNHVANWLLHHDRTQYDVITTSIQNTTAISL